MQKLFNVHALGTALRVLCLVVMLFVIVNIFS